MPGGGRVLRPALSCLRAIHSTRPSIRSYSQSSPWALHHTPPTQDEETVLPSSPSPPLDPNLATTRKEERALQRAGLNPVGSRRRRAALQSSDNLPFEQLPFQCFQEARKVLQADREEKLVQIEEARARIAKLRAKPAAACGGEHEKQKRLRSMDKYLERLKILTDINDPVIKKRFEDGEGDMNRPIYRHLADKQWRSYRRPLIMQRITQMNVIPDILPTINPTADVQLAFHRHKVQPGEFVESRVSEVPAKLRVQVFDKGERLVSVVVIDPDVPDLAKDSFSYRCHYLAINMPLAPDSPSLPLSKVPEESTVLSWLPPYAQKGSPYHRLSVFVLQQKPGGLLDASILQKSLSRDGFVLRSFIDKHGLRLIGANMFRSQWDDGTAGVMARAGIEGANIGLLRKRVEPLKKMPLPLKKKKNRGDLPTKRL